MEPRDDDEACDECGEPTGNPENEQGLFFCSERCEADSRERQEDARAAYAEYRTLFPEGMKRDGPQTMDELHEVTAREKRALKNGRNP